MTLAWGLLKKYWLHALVLLAVLYLGLAIYGRGLINGRAEVQAQWAEQTRLALEDASVALRELNAELIKSQSDAEQLRLTFIDYKAGKERETQELERAVAAGTVGLSVRATCPATTGRVQTAAANASRAGGGTAILTPAAGQDYFAFRRAYDEQFAQLKLCRSTLKQRSSSPDNQR